MIPTKNITKTCSTQADDSFIRVDLINDFDNSLTDVFLQEEIPIAGLPPESAGFNYSKLQAVVCIGLSALLSAGLILWMIKSYP